MKKITLLQGKPGSPDAFEVYWLYLIHSFIPATFSRVPERFWNYIICLWAQCHKLEVCKKQGFQIAGAMSHSSLQGGTQKKYEV